MFTCKRQERNSVCLDGVYVGVYACVQAKQKKMRERYGDQDEEERELRMKILAVSCVIHTPPCTSCHD